ncbi:MAG: Gfo/Idh/MocA family oxidoreductase [Planctomycetes bacterium]|nr:Gfo/Idh/MocA family oxidoreductase [Planctomycetota bacterium]
MMDRRSMIASGALAAGALLASNAAGATVLPRAARRPFRGRLGKVQLLQVGVGGSIAPADRDELKQHPDVVFTGLCDVDADALAAASKDHPEAFTCRDFREAFDRHAGKFDGVVVCTPDHNHALIMMTALKAGKHVYGQKPLVQQLSEVRAILGAVKARPSLVTQVGNQRMGPTGRQHAVDILRRGLLGKAIEAHVWISGPGDQGDGYFYYGGMKDPIAPPANVDWKLWLGAAKDAPCREGLVGLRWRSSWDYGTGQLGDWCTHLLDVLYFAYELPSPIAVVSQTRTASDFYHAQHVHSTLTYPVSGERFAKDRFVVHYCDKSQAPSRAALGLPAGSWPGIGTLVVCEGGVLLVEPEGKIQVWQGGKPVDWKTIPGQGEVQARNHWHSWIDRITGKPGAFVQTPFTAGAGMAEAGLLCCRAARHPGKELRWDRATDSFVGNDEATNSIVRREYRPGFELPAFG